MPRFKDSQLQETGGKNAAERGAVQVNLALSTAFLCVLLFYIFVYNALTSNFFCLFLFCVDRRKLIYIQWQEEKGFFLLLLSYSSDNFSSFSCYDRLLVAESHQLCVVAIYFQTAQRKKKWLTDNMIIQNLKLPNGLPTLIIRDAIDCRTLAVYD